MKRSSNVGKSTPLLTLIAAAAMIASLILALSGCDTETIISGGQETPPVSANGEEIGQTPPEPDPQPQPEPLPVSGLTVALSHGSGVYDKEFSLGATLDGEGEIYYTLDGSDPRVSDTRALYDGEIAIRDRTGDANVLSAIPTSEFDSAWVTLNAGRTDWECYIPSPPDEAVDKCTVVKLAGKDADGLYTDVAAGTYFIGAMDGHITGLAESCAASGTPLAVVSISMEADDLFGYEQGIYVRGKTFYDHLSRLLAEGERLESDPRKQVNANYKQRGREWERETHVELFECLPGETRNVLSQDCGIRIQGNFSRSDLQKGFRLYARKDYGEKNFKYAVFGEELTNNAGEVMDKFSTLVLRNGGNCAFTTKYSDAFWQSLVTDYAVETQASRPCVVYLNGEYWGLYILQEDYTNDYFEDVYGVDKSDVVLYKGDAEVYDIGYKLDEGDLPEGADEDYYFADLLAFFDTHDDLTAQADYDEFAKLVDIESARDYYAIELWINNKWDWPGKNWSMWRTINVNEENPYADGRWRFCLYDVEFGGVSGSSDARTNTIREDNYQTYGMLDMNTGNPSVLVFAYLMTNEGFREDFAATILGLSDTAFEKEHALERLDYFKNTYYPLYDQFFARFCNGSSRDAVYGGYASYGCIRDFLSLRAGYIQSMLDWVEKHYA